MISSACAGLLIKLLAPAFRTAVRASIPISAVRAIIGSSSSRTSRMYLLCYKEIVKGSERMYMREGEVVLKSLCEKLEREEYKNGTCEDEGM